MADLAITEALVALGGLAVQFEKVQAGEAIARGKSYYLKTSDNKYWLTDADVAASALASGIALTPAAADGIFIGCKSGLFIPGGTLVIGSEYYCTPTPGGIGLFAEVLSGDFPTRLFVALTTTLAQVQIIVAGVAKP